MVKFKFVFLSQAAMNKAFDFCRFYPDFMEVSDVADSAKYVKTFDVTFKSKTAVSAYFADLLDLSIYTFQL